MITLHQCGIDGIQVFKSGAKSAAGARFLEQVASGEIFAANESAQALAQEQLGIEPEAAPEGARYGNSGHFNWDAKAYARYADISLAEARAQFDAVYDYSAENYSEIRSNQRNGIPDERVDRIESLLRNSTPFAGEVHRGMGFSDLASAEAFLNGGQVGAEFKMNTMNSWSSNREVADTFAAESQGKVQVMLTARNRSGVSIRNIASLDEEDEVLVPSGAHYRIVDRRARTIQDPIQGRVVVYNVTVEEY